jgi:predicted acylesterase/phospholipase RssA
MDDNHMDDNHMDDNHMDDNHMDVDSTRAKTKVGVALQGGVFSAGTFDAGVMQTLFAAGLLDQGSERGTHEVIALSGTSSGALVAAVAWAHAVLRTPEQAPEALEQIWRHVDYGCIPNAEVADATFWADRLWEINPMYRDAKEWVGVPWMRHMFTSWIDSCLPMAAVREALRHPRRPADLAHLVLGAAEVLKGEVRYFHLGPHDPRPDSKTVYLGVDDLSTEPVQASGSYADVNGYTTIATGPGAGTYCDGAWGTNPPLTPLIDCGVQEIWVVQVFPKKRLQIPRTHAEREDRKEELWQNSLVEHEHRMIDKVNEWLAGSPVLQKAGKRQISVKTLAIDKDLGVGDKFVNSWPFMREMMKHGRECAETFLRENI